MIANLLEILIFGSLILLGIILIANPLNVNRKANIWFGIFLFLWAFFWLDEIVHMIGGETIGLGSDVLLNFIRFLTPLAFYISIRCFTNPEYTFGTKGLLYLILPALYLLLLILDNLPETDLKIASTVTLLLHGLIYAFLSLYQIRKHKRDIEQFASSTTEINLSWLLHIVWATLILVVAITLFNMLFFDAPLNVFMNGLVYLVILFTAYHSLKQKEIFPKDNEERADTLSLLNEYESDITPNKIMPDKKLVEIKTQLNDLIAKEELYLDSDLNLGKLAKKLNISTHQLSYVINNGFNQNFYGFINKYRVEKAQKLLAGKALDKFSIIGIAYESGFNSKTAFNTTFKKITGLTPSEFIKSGSGL
jgi:AraC-like DNA-binding protein